MISVSAEDAAAISFAISVTVLCSLFTCWITKLIVSPLLTEYRLKRDKSCQSKFEFEHASILNTHLYRTHTFKDFDVSVLMLLWVCLKFGEVLNPAQQKRKNMKYTSH